MLPGEVLNGKGKIEITMNEKTKQKITRCAKLHSLGFDGGGSEGWSEPGTFVEGVMGCSLA
jgi:hypothetical protein